MPTFRDVQHELENVLLFDYRFAGNKAMGICQCIGVCTSGW